MKTCLIAFCFFISCFLASAQTPCAPEIDVTPLLEQPPGYSLCNRRYCGNTGGFTVDNPDIDFPCGNLNGNQWISLIANSSGEIALSFMISECYKVAGELGAQLRLYNLNLDPVSGCLNHCNLGTTPGILKATNLLPGDSYLLMIDQCATGDSCDFVLTVEQGTDVIDIKPERIFAIPDRISFCIPEEAVFYISSIPNIDEYIWKVPNNVEILEGGSNQDTFVRIKFIDYGLNRIEVTPISRCREGQSAFFQMFAQTRTVRLSEIICPGDSFPIGDEFFSEPGDHQVFFPNTLANNCDSLVLLDLKIPDTSQLELECIQDTFLNVLGINWNRKALADEYQIYVTDSLVATQSFLGYIYHPQFPGEEIDIKIQPIGSHGCEYAPGYLTCTAPDLTNSKEIFKEESVSVFPNPSSGVFEVFSKEKIERIEVFDFSGKEIQEVFDTEIDLFEYESGVYFLKIIIEDKSIIKKILKN